MLGRLVETPEEYKLAVACDGVNDSTLPLLQPVGTLDGARRGGGDARFDVRRGVDGATDVHRGVDGATDDGDDVAGGGDYDGDQGVPVDALDDDAFVVYFEESVKFVELVDSE